MPFHLTVSAMELEPHFDASAEFPNFSTAPLGTSAVMMQFRTKEGRVNLLFMSYYP
jgi:hypothetical protein